MKRTGNLLLAFTLAAWGAGCDSSDDATDNQSSAMESAAEMVADASGTARQFDLDDLPNDFPAGLIPPKYDTAEYFRMGPIDGATFTSDDDVVGSIDHYKSMLGQPFSEVGEKDGEQMVQWHLDTWVVGVLGHTNETLVTVTRKPVK